MQKVNIDDLSSINSQPKAHEKTDIISAKGRFKLVQTVKRQHSSQASTQVDRSLPTSDGVLFIGIVVVVISLAIYAVIVVPWFIL